jgi:hypothetical protein
MLLFHVNAHQFDIRTPVSSSPVMWGDFLHQTCPCLQTEFSLCVYRGSEAHRVSCPVITEVPPPKLYVNFSRVDYLLAVWSANVKLSIWNFQMRFNKLIVLYF